MREDINNTVGKIRKEAREKMVGYITAAFGLVAGLAWNEAIITLINELFPIGRNTIFAKFVYAIIITVVLIVVSMYIVRFIRKKEEEEIKN